MVIKLLCTPLSLNMHYSNAYSNWAGLAGLILALLYWTEKGLNVDVVDIVACATCMKDGVMHTKGKPFHHHRWRMDIDVNK